MSDEVLITVREWDAMTPAQRECLEFSRPCGGAYFKINQVKYQEIKNEPRRETS